MKKNQISRTTSAGNAKGKNKWNEVFITAFVIITIGGFLVWLPVHTYQQERKEKEMRDQYQAALPIPGIPLDHKLVCMVNNLYIGVDQIPVVVQNKTYYGCCEKCVQDLKTNESVRFAVDLYTQSKVDKALAFITMSPVKPGRILYFESAEDAKKYLKK